MGNENMIAHYTNRWVITAFPLCFCVNKKLVHCFSKIYTIHCSKVL